VFASVEGFRKFHATHHQYTSLPGDGNRHIWYTHTICASVLGEAAFCEVSGPIAKARMATIEPTNTAAISNPAKAPRCRMSSEKSPKWNFGHRECLRDRTSFLASPCERMTQRHGAEGRVVAEQEPGRPARTRLISNHQILIAITGRRISDVQSRPVGATPGQRRDHIASLHALNAKLLDAHEPWPAPRDGQG